MTRNQYWLIIPAAGSGRRFDASGPPKQYSQIAGCTMLEWACSAFLGDRRCAGAVFALAADDAQWPAVRARLERAGLAPVIEAPGGAERVDSVRNALQALGERAQPEDLVLVHDAARPCLERVDVESLLRAATECADGALLAAPLADTLKRGAGEHVQQTLPREQLWRALTPQAARFARLRAALDNAAKSGRVPTDEAQALEWMGAAPRLVTGAASNLKVTTLDDLGVAKALLEARVHANLPGGASRAR